MNETTMKKAELTESTEPKKKISRAISRYMRDNAFALNRKLRGTEFAKERSAKGVEARQRKRAEREAAKRAAGAPIP